MPKHRVPTFQEDASCRQSARSPWKSLPASSARPGARASSTCARMRTFGADPRLIPASLRRSHVEPWRWAGELAGTSAIVVCQRGLKLSQGVAAWLRHAGMPAESLEGGLRSVGGRRACRCPRTENLPPRDAEGSHDLGDPRAPEDRPHRLSLADPALRRSACRLPLRGAGGGRGRSRSVRRRAVRHRGRVLQPPRRACTFDTMLEEFGLATEPLHASRGDRARRRYGAARSRAGGGRPARCVARSVAHVFRRSRAARGRDAALRRLLPLVPRRRRRDAQLAAAPADERPGR